MGSTYVHRQPKATVVSYNYGEDGHFSKECPKHHLSSQLGLTHISCGARASGVCYKCKEISHLSKECPYHRIISHLTHPDQSHRDVAPLIRGSALGVSFGDSDA